MEIMQAIKQGGEEAEIAYLVSLWSDQMDSDTVDNTPGHKEVTGRLITDVTVHVRIRDDVVLMTHR